MTTASLQLAGIAKLEAISAQQAAAYGRTIPLERTPHRAHAESLPGPAPHPGHRRRRRRVLGRGRQVPVAPGQNSAPAVTLTARRHSAAAAAVSGLLAVAVAAWGAHHVLTARAVLDGAGTPLSAIYVLTFALLAWQVILYAIDRPARPGPLASVALDMLTVVIAVPLYNEDPGICRRSLLSMLTQTRRVDHIYVVDDGSNDPKADYTAVRRELAGAAAAAGVMFTWVRTANGGKRHAHAVAVEATPDADVYITVDSDSVLDPKAVAELLTPLADPRVQSVAGVFMTSNNRGPRRPVLIDEDDNGEDEKRTAAWKRTLARANALAGWRASQVLARILDLLYVSGQLTGRGPMSVMGSVLVNSGALAAYRAQVLRDALPGYLGETFLGRPVGFSDDSFLTLQAYLRGRTVQQPTAFGFAAMPEKFSHHRRQYLRWMRGSFIRSWWRFRYLPLRSYAYWMHLAGWALSAVSAWAFVEVYVLGALSGTLRWSYLLVPVVVGYGAALPYLTVTRSDERFRSRLLTWALAPIAVLWALTVLRVFRWWGVVTCRDTGWGTRQTVEVTLEEPNG